MGSSLESAIVFSIVLIILCYLVFAPEELLLNSLNLANSGISEIEYQTEDNGVMNKKIIDYNKSVSTSPERFCTYLKGITDNYYFTYGAIREAVKDE